jgi:hypothetical protein
LEEATAAGSKTVCLTGGKGKVAHHDIRTTVSMVNSRQIHVASADNVGLHPGREGYAGRARGGDPSTD